MRMCKFLFITLILLLGTGCALKQAVDENPIRIEGRYEFVSLDLSVFGNINTQPVQNGEASFNPVRRFRARYIDPILKREIVNLDG
ncbi:MAG: hypothetical protein FD167_4990, partial [bacterium]